MLPSLLLAASLAGAEPAGRKAVIPSANNAEMTAIFDADQAIRSRLAKEGFNQKLAMEIWTGDSARRARTKALLEKGELRTGDDFRHAAFVFQHGGKPDDYLLAHTLAVVAVARGRADATWIAAATLDRYLQEIGRKQIYGTQYTTPAGQPTTQEPYDRTLVPDQLRKALGVPDQAAQEARRKQIEQRHRKAPAPAR